jgi:ABC-type antimicrobial peptide transport system permease subunit
MLMGISSAFGLLTLFLAAIGVYSVVAVTVHRRRQEMRIRLVLGANPQTVRRHMIMDGLRPTIVGLGIGTLVTIPAARTMESLLFAVSALDPLTLSATAVLLFGIATAAAYAPTWRAVRVKPTVSGE